MSNKEILKRITEEATTLSSPCNRLCDDVEDFNTGYELGAKSERNKTLQDVIDMLGMVVDEYGHIDMCWDFIKEELEKMRIEK